MATTLLDAINRLLVARGVAPVSDEDSSHPDVTAAKTLLEAHKRNISGEKWWFNTETATLSPDADGFIKVPTRVESLDNEDNNMIINGKLYSLENRTSVYTEDVEDIILIYNRDWDELPVQAFEFIVASAKEEFIRPLESQILTTRAENDITKAKALLDIADFRYKDVGEETGNPLMQKWRTKMLVR